MKQFEFTEQQYQDFITAVQQQNKIELTEFPLYMKRFLISYLCYELSIIFKYLDKTALFKKEMILEKTRIINLQGLIVKEW